MAVRRTVRPVSERLNPVWAARYLSALADYLNGLTGCGEDALPAFDLGVWLTPKDPAGCRTAACAVGHGWLGGVLPPDLVIDRGIPRYFNRQGMAAVADAYRIPYVVALGLFSNDATEYEIEDDEPDPDPDDNDRTGRVTDPKVVVARIREYLAR